MNAKALCTCALVLAVLGECAARADDLPKSAAAMPTTPSAPPPGTTGPLAGGAVEMAPGHAPPSIANWLGWGCQDGSCNSCGTNGCIFGEFYVASGFSFPIEGTVFNKALDVGWTIQVGFRTDFFNVAQDAAWTVDFSVSHTHNRGISGALAVPLLLLNTAPPPAPPVIPAVVSIHSLERTYGNLTLGRDWYLNGSAGGCGWKWRAGVDGGGRWGTATVDLEDVDRLVHFRRHDTMGGIILAAHTDAEVPWGCCLLHFGLRLEWDYNFIDILQGNDTDFQELNLLGTVGVRF
jgi:hypothetical protein